MGEEMAAIESDIGHPAQSQGALIFVKQGAQPLVKEDKLEI